MTKSEMPLSRMVMFAVMLAAIVFAAVARAETRGLGLGWESRDPAVVKSVNFGRYVGFWYEIAHAPNWFQTDCARSTAEYKELTATSVSVLNTCYTADNSVSDIQGTATVVDPKTPAKLEVEFNFFARGDYWIVDLDPNYQWSVVSGPNKQSLFILSRTAPMEPALLKSILNRLQKRGFDVDNLIFDKY